MDIKEQKAIIEAMLFATGRAVKIDEIMQILDMDRKEAELILQQMRLEYEEKNNKNSKYLSNVYKERIL